MLDDTVQRRIPIPILVCDDIAAMHAWLVRVFGLGAGRLEHDTEGRCVHGELKAGDGVIWLHQVSPQFGLVLPSPAWTPPTGTCRRHLPLVAPGPGRAATGHQRSREHGGDRCEQAGGRAWPPATPSSRAGPAKFAEVLSDGGLGRLTGAIARSTCR